MKTNTDCTVLNAYYNEDAEEWEYRATRLDAVFWNPSKGKNVIQSGLSDADGLKVLIPFQVKSDDKNYVSPQEYAALPPSSVDEHWTLSTGEKNTPDIVIKGAGVTGVVMIEQIAALRKKYELYAITTVDTKDFGSEFMRHWKVGGK